MTDGRLVGTSYGRPSADFSDASAAEMPDEQDAKALLAEHLFTRPKARPVMEDLIASELGDKAADAIPGYRARKAVEAELAELRKLRDEVKAWNKLGIELSVPQLSEIEAEALAAD